VTGQENGLAEIADPIPVPPSTAQPTSISFQTLYLRRLARLIHQEAEWRGRVEPDDWRIKLIQRSIYSTYRDCATNEAAESARDLLHDRRYNP
jgi:hypothetical protein